MSGEEDLIKSPSKSPSISADTNEFIEETLQELDNTLQDLDKFSLSDIPEVSSQSKIHTLLGQS